MNLARLCFQLDEACPGYEFLYTRSGNEAAICVYKKSRGSLEERDRIALIPCPDHERDYAITKIILQFGR